MEKVTIKKTTKCWCGEEAIFHHVSSGDRMDGKTTIWYKCPQRHRVYVEV